jgi:hydroxymethylbilane synthase
MKESQAFVIGHDDAPLAKAEAELVASKLLDAFPDKFGDGKRKIEFHALPYEEYAADDALRNGTVTINVRSVKDLPIPEMHFGIWPCVLPRKDAREVWVSSEADAPESLPSGAWVGLNHIARNAQLNRHMKEAGKYLRLCNIYGNVVTRAERIFEQPPAINSTIMSAAAFEFLKDSLGKDMGKFVQYYDTTEFLPRPGQGATAIQCKADDDEVQGFLAKLNCRDSRNAVLCERAFLRALGLKKDGSTWGVPALGYAEVFRDPDTDHEEMRFGGLVMSRDGTTSEEIKAIGDPNNAEMIGQGAAQLLKQKLPTKEKARGKKVTDWSKFREYMLPTHTYSEARYNATSAAMAASMTEEELKDFFLTTFAEDPMIKNLKTQVEKYMEKAV